jgi:uncharacterized membrane protein
MSDLIAIAYPDQSAVEGAREGLREGVKAGVIEVEDVVVLIRDEDGALDIRQGSSGLTSATVGGGMAGGLIGLLFLAPLFGMAVGAVGAREMWKSMFGDVGVTERFVEELSEHLDPGGAAMIMLVREMDLDAVLPRIEVHGHVIRTTLSAEAESKLDAVLAAAKSDGS